jgi:hypothetical protein
MKYEEFVVGCRLNGRREEPRLLDAGCDDAENFHIAEGYPEIVQPRCEFAKFLSVEWASGAFYGCADAASVVVRNDIDSIAEPLTMEDIRLPTTKREQASHCLLELTLALLASLRLAAQPLAKQPKIGV